MKPPPRDADIEALGATADRLRDLGATTVEVEHFDALDPAGHADLVDKVFDRHRNIDVVLAAFGVLGDQELAVSRRHTRELRDVLIRRARPRAER